MLQKSGCGGSSSDSIVMAGYAGLVQLLGGPVADPGVPGGDRAAVPGLDVVVVVVVVRGAPEMYTEELGVHLDAPVVGPLVQDATGCQFHASLEYDFLQL